MDIANYTNMKGGYGFPSEEVQMERIRQGALGGPAVNSVHNAQPQFNPREENRESQPVDNSVQNITTAELDRLRNIDNMLRTGELTSKYEIGSGIKQQNETIAPQRQEGQGMTQDQGSSIPDWMAQFDTGNQQNDNGNVNTVGAESEFNQPMSNNSNGYKAPQNESPSEAEIALIREGVKNGISGDAMIDFARQLKAEDYLMLYRFKQEQASKTAPPINAPMDNSNAQNPQGYQPRYFSRINKKSIPGPSITDLSGAHIQPRTNNSGLPSLAGSGAENYII